MPGEPKMQKVKEKPKSELGGVVVLDFGGQYTQLIARRIREQQVFSAILPCTASLEEIKQYEPAGIVLSGGPSSVYDADAPKCDPKVLALGIPVLGICYGMQWITHALGGKVERAERREYGRAHLKVACGSGSESSHLFMGVPESLRIWNSHGDHVLALPAGFRATGHTENAIAAVEDPKRQIYAVQFHVEVNHTERGTELLRNFLFRVCKAEPKWSGAAFFEQTLEMLRDRLKLHVIGVDASDRFLAQLKGVIDPEEKRRRIGREFIAVFAEEAQKLQGGKARGEIGYLVQGTLYPDVIESVSVKGPSATIKTHHNVGGLPEKMPFDLIEPLRDLFKDEVRRIGRDLGLPDEILVKHPFPGPGLAVRLLGEITREHLVTLREADAIVVEEIRRAGFYEKVWQAFAVLLPVRSVGVMGDGRTYGLTVAVRVVESHDAMTADWVKLPSEVLERISTRIVNEVPGVTRVVYDISSKPPSTIEWE